jgi:hypothetical protein
VHQRASVDCLTSLLLGDKNTIHERNKDCDSKSGSQDTLQVTLFHKKIVVFIRFDVEKPLNNFCFTGFAE